jgi:hypothetical protein
MIKPEDNFYTCFRCGQKIFTDWKSSFHIHPPICHAEQIFITSIVLEKIPIGIAACI